MFFCGKEGDYLELFCALTVHAHNFPSNIIIVCTLEIGGFFLTPMFADCISLVNILLFFHQSDWFSHILLSILTIRLRACVFYERNVNEVQPSSLLFIENKDKLSNCVVLDSVIDDSPKTNNFKNFLSPKSRIIFSFKETSSIVFYQKTDNDQGQQWRNEWIRFTESYWVMKWRKKWK